MEANIIVVEERRKNRALLSGVITKILPSINIIESIDGGVASAKFANQKFDFLILNIDIKVKPAIKFLKDILMEKKIAKENIVVFYDEVSQEQVKSLVELGITDVISYKADITVIQSKLTNKLANMVRAKNPKKVA